MWPSICIVFLGLLRKIPVTPSNTALPPSSAAFPSWSSLHLTRRHTYFFQPLLLFLFDFTFLSLLFLFVSPFLYSFLTVFIPSIEFLNFSCSFVFLILFIRISLFRSLYFHYFFLYCFILISLFRSLYFLYFFLYCFILLSSVICQCFFLSTTLCSFHLPFHFFPFLFLAVDSLICRSVSTRYSIPGHVDK